MIPDGVKKLGDFAFGMGGGPKSAVIPPSVTVIVSSAFESDANLAVIYGAPGSAAETYAHDMGIAFKAYPQKRTVAKAVSPRYSISAKIQL